MNINKNELREVLFTLFNECNNAGYYYYISNSIYNNLEAKYEKLTNKWYLHANDCLIDSFLTKLIKLFNNEKREQSFYNMLTKLNQSCLEGNYSELTCSMVFKSYEKLMYEYKDSIKNLILLRNNWLFHISKDYIISEKNKYTILLQDAFNLYCFAIHTIKDIYNSIYDEKIEINDHFVHTEQINLFFSLLDENGNINIKS